MLGHDYCMGDNYVGIVGYGLELFQEDVELFDFEKIQELDDFEYDEEDIMIHDVFEALSEHSRRLTHVDTNNDDIGAILMLPAVLPWELNDTNRYITKEDINQEIIDLILPYVNTTKDKILSNIWDIETCEFYYEGSYGDEFLVVNGYGLTLIKSDIKFFNSEKLKELSQDEDDELQLYYAIEELAMRSNYFDCAYTTEVFDECILYFKSRMPWEYDEQTQSLTKTDIEHKIIEMILPYLNSNEDVKYFIDHIYEVSTCFYIGG